MSYTNSTKWYNGDLHQQYQVIQWGLTSTVPSDKMGSYTNSTKWYNEVSQQQYQAILWGLTATVPSDRTNSYTNSNIYIQI